MGGVRKTAFLEEARACPSRTAWNNIVKQETTVVPKTYFTFVSANFYFHPATILRGYLLMQCDMRLLNLVVMLPLRWKPHCGIHELCRYKRWPLLLSSQESDGHPNP